MIFYDHLKEILYDYLKEISCDHLDCRKEFLVSLFFSQESYFWVFYQDLQVVFLNSYILSLSLDSVVSCCQLVFYWDFFLVIFFLDFYPVTFF